MRPETERRGAGNPARLLLLAVALHSVCACPCAAEFPTAGFSAEPASGPIPLLVSFTDLSTGDIDSWEWDLDGDGFADSRERNPFFTYERQGAYTVSLYVKGPDGEDRETRADFIRTELTPGGPGTVQWEIELAAWTRSSPALADDGTIYFASGDGLLHAVRPDGVPAWTYQTGGEVVTGSPSIDGDTVYLPCRDGRVYAVRDDGTLKWQTPLPEGSFCDGFIAVRQDGEICLASRDDAQGTSFLQTLRSDGTEHWSRKSLSFFYDPVVDRLGNVYVAQCRRLPSGSFRGVHLLAFDPEGAPLWETELSAGVSCGHLMPPALGRFIYVPTSSGLFALDYDGLVRWVGRIEYDDCEVPPCYATVGPVNSVVVGDGVVYVGNLNGELYALDEETGLAWWQFRPEIRFPAIWGTPCLGSDGSVYALYYSESDGISGRLCAVDPDGRQIWYCLLSFMNANSCSPVIRDGVLYAGTDFGRRFYAVHVSGTLAETDWPMVHRDPRHTGRSPAAPAECPDGDRDGYGSPATADCPRAGLDCDDDDPGVHPGAPEVCDGVDNNCVSGADEEPAASATCDDSAFCNGREACAAGSCLPGALPCADDGLFCNGAETCDEAADACLHSGNPCPPDADPCTEDRCIEARDACRHRCNATSPEDPCCGSAVCAGTAVCLGPCEDDDGDGYGDPAGPACPEAARDCDDDDPLVNPGEVEARAAGNCGNRQDDDCDDLVDTDAECAEPAGREEESGGCGCAVFPGARAGTSPGLAAAFLLWALPFGFLLLRRRATRAGRAPRGGRGQVGPRHGLRAALAGFPFFATRPAADSEAAGAAPSRQGRRDRFPLPVIRRSERA